MSTLAQKKHRKQLRRNRKKVSQKKYQRFLQREEKNKQKKETEIGTLYTSMLESIEPENFEQWVKDLDVRPEYKEELEILVAEELKRRSNTDDVGNFKFGEETKTDEPVETPEEDTGNFEFGS